MKQPMAAYGHFVKMCCAEHKRKYPNEHLIMTEISRKCAEKWRTMNEAEKMRFVELAEADLQRYQQECVAGGLEPRRKRQKKDPNAPKRNLSAFFFFSHAKRPEIQAEHPEWRVGQVAQELGRLWREIDPNLKTGYEVQAQDDRLRYESEMKEFKAGRPVASVIARQQLQLQQQSQLAQSQQQVNAILQGQAVQQQIQEPSSSSASTSLISQQQQLQLQQQQSQQPQQQQVMQQIQQIQQQQQQDQQQPQQMQQPTTSTGPDNMLFNQQLQLQQQQQPQQQPNVEQLQPEQQITSAGLNSVVSGLPEHVQNQQDLLQQHQLLIQQMQQQQGISAIGIQQ